MVRKGLDWLLYSLLYRVYTVSSFVPVSSQWANFPIFIIPSFFSRFSSGCKVRGSCGPGAHLSSRPKDRPQDDDARDGPCCP